MMIVKYANPPSNCDICSVRITDVFIDGRTKFGQWGSMCPKCHWAHGLGLGTGRGQAYRKVRDGSYLKISDDDNEQAKNSRRL